MQHRSNWAQTGLAAVRRLDSSGWTGLDDRRADGAVVALVFFSCFGCLMNSIKSVPGLAQALGTITTLTLQPRVSIVGVSGFSSAGKTTLCNAIVEARPEDTIRLDCDSLSAFSLRERQERIAQAVASGDRRRIHFEKNPQNWYDWHKIQRSIETLRRDRHFLTRRAWNRQTGQLDALYELSLPPSGPVVVLCDCIFLLHAPVRRWFDSVLLVHTSDVAIARRSSERAKSPAAEYQARARRETFERPYFRRYAEFADMVLSQDTTGE